MTDRTSNASSTWWLDRVDWPATRHAALLLAMVFSSLVFVSCAVWQMGTPHWKSDGYVKFVGYGKNLEHLALGLSLAVATVGGLLLPRSSRSRWFVLAVAGCALVVALNLIMPRPKLALPLTLAACLAYFAWWYARCEEKIDCAPQAAEPWPKFLSMGLFGIALLFAFVQFMAPRPIDLFHQGEVVLCARDWLAGGKPYETMFWPHGMHDSWLPAQVLRWSGSGGLGIYAVMFCVGGLSGAAGCYLIAWNLMRRHSEAALVTVITVAILPMAIYSLGWTLFGLLALHLLANRQGRRAVFAAGALLGWAFLWRIDTGTFAIVAAAGFLLFDEYYTRGYRQAGTLWSNLKSRQRLRCAVRRLGLLSLGMLAMFAVTRVTLGLPTLRMLEMSLFQLPRYHADNTGIPLPLPVADMQRVGVIYAPFMAWTTALYLLFCVSLAVFLAVKAREKRLSMETPRARFLVLAALLSLLHVKVGIDRSDVPHLFSAMTPMLLVASFDLIGWLSRQMKEGWQRMAIVGGGTGFAFGMVVLGVLCSDLSGRPLRDHLKVLANRALEPGEGRRQLAIALRPTEAWPQLLDASADPLRPQIQQGVEQLRKILDANQVGPRQFLAVHSAPMLYPLTNRQSPTKYYLLGWAMNDAMQHEAVQELEAAQVKAVLKTNGLGGTISAYDVPDEQRVPIIHRFVQKAAQDCVVYPTSFGPLHVRCDAGAPGYRLSMDQVDQASSLTHQAESLIYKSVTLPLSPEGSLGNLDACQIEGDELHILGWAGSAALGCPAEAVLVFCGEKCLHASFPHEPRPDVAAVFGKPELAAAGVHLRLPKAWLGSAEMQHLRVVSVCQGQAAVMTVAGQTLAQRERAKSELK